MGADLIPLIRYLLPSFLAAWIFYGLCAHQKPEQFERVVQALIFTIIVQAASSIHVLLQTNVIAIPSTSTAEEILPSMYAIIIGVVFAWAANRDVPHRILRKLGMTEQTSYPSEWFRVFSSHKRYLVLHLNDERRLYGWPKEWPQSYERGHFFMTQPAWLLDDFQSADAGSEVTEQYLGSEGVEGILVSVKDVKWVEVMQKV